MPLTLFGEALFSGIDAFALIAIPLFILTGDVLVRSGLSNKLLDVAEATMGSLRTGLGTSTVLGCGFFACISGSDAAGAAAVGRITIKRLTDSGYPLPYACALVASGACTGILIPPSIAYIIMGLVLGISASTLFLAAAVPGVLIMISIMITNVIINRRRGYEHSRAQFSFARWTRAIWDGKYALMIPFIILGGIYSGIFTPTEAAAVAVVTTITIGMMQGTLSLSDFPKMLESSAKVNGVIVPIIAFALPLAQVLAALEVPQTFVQGITVLTSDPTLIVLMMLGIFIAAGCVMETTPNIVILSPILLPVVKAFGIDPVHFGIIICFNLIIGIITPPMGIGLFVAARVAGITPERVLRATLPFFVPLLLGLMIVSLWPQLTLWLPNLVFGPSFG